MSSGANLAHCQRVSAQRSHHAAGGRTGTGCYHRGYNYDSEGGQGEMQVADSLTHPSAFPSWISPSRPSGSMQGPRGKPPTRSGSGSGSAEIVYKVKGNAKLQDVMSDLSDDHGEACWKKGLTHSRSWGSLAVLPLAYLALNVSPQLPCGTASPVHGMRLLTI